MGTQTPRTAKIVIPAGPACARGASYGGRLPSLTRAIGGAFTSTHPMRPDGRPVRRQE